MQERRSPIPPFLRCAGEERTSSKAAIRGEPVGLSAILAFKTLQVLVLDHREKSF